MIDENNRLGAVGTAFAGVGAFLNFSAARNAEGWQQIENVASGAQASLEVLRGALNAVERVDQLSKSAIGAGRVLARVSPVVGIAANLAALAAHAQDFSSDPNAGLLLALIGDAAALTGSFLESSPWTAPLGAPIAAVGALVSTAGDALSNRIRSRADNERQHELLENIGVAPNAARTLAFGDRDSIADLRALGLSTEHLETLAAQYQQSLFDGSGVGVPLDGIQNLARAFGLNGEQVFDVLSSIGSGTDDESDGALRLVLDNLARSSSAATSPDEWRGILRQFAADFRREAHDDENQLFNHLAVVFERLAAQL